MRIGLIGFGAWGELHARAVAHTPDALLCAIATRGNQDEARDAWPEARVTADWRSVAQDPALDAVVVAVPNALHAEVAVTALQAGRHVLLEKPMALTIADCDRLIAAARASGRVLTVGHELRLSEQWGRVRALIEAGSVGKLRHASVSLFRFPYRTGSEGWRYDGASVGSWILEEPVHFFDLLLWYGQEWGAPETIQAVADGSPAMPLALAATLRFLGGEFATLNTVLGGFEHHLAVHAMGDAGAIRATWSAAMDRSTRASAALHLFRGRAGPGETGDAVAFGRSGEVFELAVQAERAIAGFREGRALMPAEAARDAVRACLLAERSAREGGREVAWSEAVG